MEIFKMAYSLSVTIIQDSLVQMLLFFHNACALCDIKLKMPKIKNMFCPRL